MVEGEKGAVVRPPQEGGLDAEPVLEPRQGRQLLQPELQGGPVGQHIGDDQPAAVVEGVVVVLLDEEHHPGFQDEGLFVDPLGPRPPDDDHQLVEVVGVLRVAGVQIRTNDHQGKISLDEVVLEFDLQKHV